MFVLDIDKSPGAEPTTYSRCVVAVCAGTNPLDSSQHAIEMIQFLANIHQHILILVCDEIARHELVIRSNTSTTKAEREASRYGDKMSKHLNSALNLLPHHRDKVHVVRWKDIRDPTYTKIMAHVQDQVPKLYGSELERNSIFYIHRRHPMIKTVTKPKIDSFSQYTLEELPVQIKGVVYNNQHYNYVYHPVYVGSIQLAENYISPIADLAQKLKEDPEFMQPINEIVNNRSDAHVQRLYWTK